jgi:hypothetical protein
VVGGRPVGNALEQREKARELAEKARDSEREREKREQQITDKVERRRESVCYILPLLGQSSVLGGGKQRGRSSERVFREGLHRGSSPMFSMFSMLKRLFQWCARHDHRKGLPFSSRCSGCSRTARADHVTDVREARAPSCGTPERLLLRQRPRCRLASHSPFVAEASVPLLFHLTTFGLRAHVN